MGHHAYDARCSYCRIASEPCLRWRTNATPPRPTVSFTVERFDPLASARAIVQAAFLSSKLPSFGEHK